MTKESATLDVSDPMSARGLAIDQMVPRRAYPRPTRVQRPVIATGVNRWGWLEVRWAVEPKALLLKPVRNALEAAGF